MNAEKDNIKSQMRKGMLEYCILLLISHNKLYPSDIISQLHKANMIVVEGTIYTLLNRLRREGKLDYEWQESPKGPPRKYFKMTAYGENILHEMREAWDEINVAVNHFEKISQEIKLQNTQNELSDITPEQK